MDFRGGGKITVIRTALNKRVTTLCRRWRGYMARDEYAEANARGRRRRSGFSPASQAHYDARRDRIVITLRSGLELGFAPHDAQELEGASPTQLQRVEITPSGLGIYFPDADADIYLPALMEGMLGSRRWMASRLGRSGGRSRSDAKVAASRANGRLGGRPRKIAG